MALPHQHELHASAGRNIQSADALSLQHLLGLRPVCHVDGLILLALLWSKDVVTHGK